jgi:hypothetical protein
MVWAAATVTTPRIPAHAITTMPRVVIGSRS